MARGKVCFAGVAVLLADPLSPPQLEGLQVTEKRNPRSRSAPPMKLYIRAEVRSCAQPLPQHKPTAYRATAVIAPFTVPRLLTQP